MEEIDREIEILQSSINIIKDSNYDQNQIHILIDSLCQNDPNLSNNLKNIISNLFDVIRNKNDSILKIITIDDLKKLNLLIDSFVELLNNIKISNINVAQDRQILKNIFDAVSSKYYRIEGLIDFLKISKYIFGNSNIENFISNVDLCKAFKANGDEIEKLKNQSKEIELEHRKILIRTKTGYEHSLVIESNKYFHETSKYFEREADLWGWFVAANFVLSFIIAGWFYLSVQVADDYFDLTKIFLSKFVIFGVLVCGMVFGAKIYMSNKHNYTLNRQKQNALETFLPLVSAANSEDKRDIILTYAANCIYSQQDTGFNNQSSGSANPSDQIAKVAEAIAKLAPKATKE